MKVVIYALSVLVCNNRALQTSSYQRVRNNSDDSAALIDGGADDEVALYDIELLSRFSGHESEVEEEKVLRR